MEKINVAELLKDSPKGMELDCTICNNRVILEGVVGNGSTYPIRVISKDGFHHMLTCSGGVYDNEDSKCVIFPKGKTTWEGFHRPFKDGDVIANDRFIALFHKFKEGHMYYHCWYNNDSNNSKFKIDFGIGYIYEYRLATEEEKAKLFQAIKEHGYKWNPKTKTLEKLIQPKFKVGDRIKLNNSTSIYTITNLLKDRYRATDDSYGVHEIEFERQDAYKLVPNRFDITTLKPFDKVLVRDTNRQVWIADFFSHNIKELFGGYAFACIGHCWHQCIPYEGNEHLLGTTGDCDEYFKTW